MVMGLCRFCGKTTKLIKAHIVPQKFYTYPIATEEDKQLILVSENKHYKPKCPIGVYDENILCAECDGAFGIYDEEIQKLLLADIRRYKRKDVESLYEIPFTAFDYQKLRLFFVSMLWRASISSNDVFKHIKFGVKYEKLSLAILKDPKLDSDNFALIIMKLKSCEKAPIEKVFIQPTSCRIKGVNFYRFVFSGYRILIKVDGRKLSDGLVAFSLKPNTNLLIMEMEPEEESRFINTITSKHKLLKLENNV